MSQRDQILEIAHLDLYKVTFETVQIWLAQVYQNTLRSPRYVLLNKEDHDLVLAYLRCFLMVLPLPCFLPPDQREVVKVANYAAHNTFYLASLPDMPRCCEYSDAHRTFARAGYEQLPVLSRNSLIALFPH